MVRCLVLPTLRSGLRWYPALGSLCLTSHVPWARWINAGAGSAPPYLIVFLFLFLISLLWFPLS